MGDRMGSSPIDRTKSGRVLDTIHQEPFRFFLASIILDLSVFFKTEGAVIVSAAAA